MLTSWGTLTIGASPVQVPFTESPAGIGVCKLSFQVMPGATGAVKIGGSGLTADNTTPGTWLNSTNGTNPDTSKQPGGYWVVESQKDHNTIHPSQYYIHGTHAGDLVGYEYHQG